MVRVPRLKNSPHRCMNLLTVWPYRAGPGAGEAGPYLHPEAGTLRGPFSLSFRAPLGHLHPAPVWPPRATLEAGSLGAGASP